MQKGITSSVLDKKTLTPKSQHSWSRHIEFVLQLIEPNYSACLYSDDHTKTTALSNVEGVEFAIGSMKIYTKNSIYNITYILED